MSEGRTTAGPTAHRTILAVPSLQCEQENWSPFLPSK